MDDSIVFSTIDLFLRRNGAFRGELRVGMIPWEGEPRVHIREFYVPKELRGISNSRDGLLPGRKGVAIKGNQLRQVIEGLQAAEKYLLAHNLT